MPKDGTGNKDMGRDVVCRSLGVLLLGSVPMIAAAGDDLPPLTAPSLTPPVPNPATATPAGPSFGTDATNAPGVGTPTGPRSVLAVPGVNVPGRVRSRSTPLPALESAEPGFSGEAPRLTGPASLLDSSTPNPVMPPVQRPTIRPAAAIGRSLPLEASPAPAPVTANSKPVTAFSTTDADPGAQPDPPSTSPPTPAPTPPPISTRSRFETAPRRAPGLLSRFLTTPFAAKTARSDRDRDHGRGPTAVEPSTDPAAEAALKRRVERQVQETLGDRVHDVEVLVRGRDVTIRARANHFWQRRTVRRALESLPGLSGYRAAVDLLD